MPLAANMQGATLCIRMAYQGEAIIESREFSMPYRILVVDDEPEIVSFIQEALEGEGYEVLVAYNGDEAISASTKKPNLILLDVMMPGRDGYDVCHAVRDMVQCPIVFLSARDRESDKMKGLAVGGDDYLVKPFGIKELKARVYAHLRREERSKPAETQRRTIRYGDLVIDLQCHTITFQNDPIPFTHREFEMIQLLALHQGQVFNKEQIYDRVWGIDASGDAATVTEHVKKIRAKLAIIDQDHQYISTIWGVGYKWEVVNSN